MGDNGSFDTLAHLKGERLRAIEEATQLLWENIENGFLWKIGFINREDDVVREKIEIQYSNWHPTIALLNVSFIGTVAELVENDVKNILLYGASRRISSIYHAANSFCDMIYPERIEPLSQEESRRVSDDLLLIYVHIIGTMDAFGIALHRLDGATISKSEKDSDILNYRFRKRVRFLELEDIFKKNDKWFRRVKERFRNRYVHKVPPYVAPSVYSAADIEKYHGMQRKIDDALKSGDYDKLEVIQGKQGRLGKFPSLITFIDTDEHMPLISTVLDDLFRFQVIVLLILEELLPRMTFEKARHP